MDQVAADRFIEAMGLQWDRLGANRTLGRVLAYLLIATPAAQTAGDLASALQVSKASISTSVRTLETMGLIERTARPGQRRVHYRMRDDAWGHIARARIVELRQMIDIARIGEAAMADMQVGDRARIVAFREWAIWWLARTERTIAEWERERP